MKRFLVYLFYTIVGLGILIPSTLVTSSTVYGAADSVIATVNDVSITSRMLNQRIKLLLVSSGVEPTKEGEEKVREQVFSSLVAELIKAQAAKKAGLKVTRAMLSNALSSIQGRTGIPLKQISAMLTQAHVDHSTFTTQIRNQILWSNLISQRFQGRVSISAQEVTATLENSIKRGRQETYLLSEIVLKFKGRQEKAKALTQARDLVAQLKKGANFSTLAQHFSQAASAAAGGDIGWLPIGEIPKPILKALKDIKIGDISQPIQVNNTYVVVGLRDHRRGFGPDIDLDRYTLCRVLFSLSPDASLSDYIARNREVNTFIDNFKGCSTIQSDLSAFSGAQASRPITMEWRQMEPDMQKAIKGLKNAQISTPVRTSQGIEMVAVCAYQPDINKEPTRNSIQQSLYNQQMNVLVERYLNSLLTQAVVVIKDKTLTWNPHDKG